MVRFIYIPLILLASFSMNAQVYQGQYTFINAEATDSSYYYGKNVSGIVGFSHITATVLLHSDLSSLSPSTDELIITEGYYTRGDGGGAIYKVSNSTLPDYNGGVADGNIVVALSNGKFAILQMNESVNIKQAGSNNTYSTNETAILSLETFGVPIVIDNGTIELNNLVLDEVVDKLTIICNNVTFRLRDNATGIVANGSWFNITKKNKIFIKGQVIFDSNYQNNSTIDDDSFTYYGVNIEAKPTGTSLGDLSDNTILDIGDIGIINTGHTGMVINGIYSSVSTTETYFEIINIRSVDIGNYLGFGLTIKSLYSIVKIGSVVVSQTDRMLDFNGGAKALSFSSDTDDYEDGIDLKVNNITCHHAKDIVLFMQNVRHFNIISIFIDKALYNSDGSDSYVSVYGMVLIKLDNAKSPTSSDERSGYFGSVIIKGSNTSQSLFLKDGVTDGGDYRVSIDLQEGTNNVSFGKVDVDMPFNMSTGTEAYPKFTKGCTVETLILRKRYSGLANKLYNMTVNSLSAYETDINIQNVNIGNMNAYNGCILNILSTSLERIGMGPAYELSWGHYDFYGTTIQNSNFDENTLIDLKLSDTDNAIVNEIGKCAFLIFRLKNHRGGKFRVITSSPGGTFDIQVVKNRLQLNFDNVLIKEADLEVGNYFKNSLESLLITNNTTAGTRDLTDTGTYPPTDINATPEAGLKDLPTGVFINASRIANSYIIPHNKDYNDILFNGLTKRTTEKLIVTAGGWSSITKGDHDYESFNHIVHSYVSSGSTVYSIATDAAKEGDIVVIYNNGTIKDDYSTVLNKFINLTGLDYSESGVLHYYKVENDLCIEFDVLKINNPSYKEVSAVYTLAKDDKILNCLGASNYNITLPSSADKSVRSGKQYIIKNSGTATVTVLADGAETIDGAASKVLSTQYETLTVISNGTNWIVID